MNQVTMTSTLRATSSLASADSRSIVRAEPSLDLEVLTLDIAEGTEPTQKSRERLRVPRRRAQIANAGEALSRPRGERPGRRGADQHADNVAPPHAKCLPAADERLALC